MHDRWPSQIRIDYIDAIFRSAVDDEEECVICFGSLNNGELMAPCENGHIFHCNCINSWLSHSPNQICPAGCGSNVTIKECYMRSALAIATYAQKEEDVKSLLADGAHEGEIDDLTIYTWKKGGDHKARTVTALMIACFNGSDNIATRLLAAKANVDRVNDEGATALMFACQAGHESCVTMLLAEKADGTCPVGTAGPR